jgi:rod shape-determining protein MreD
MRHLISTVVVAVAVLLQLAVADRIVFPGGSGPDLVLLTVAALALATGPMAGSVAGFCAGLALDVAPPAGHLVGQDALVFCLVGYACGLAADSPAKDGIADQEHSALFELAVTAVGAVCGEAMIAGLGVMLSDPRVTWAAIKHVLPVSVGYDVLLSPFVLLAVAAMLRLAGSRAAEPGITMSAASRRRAAWAASPAAAGAVRQLSGSGSPRLHLSGQGRLGGSGGSGSLGSRSGPGRQGSGLGPGRREPHLRLRRSGSPGGRLGSEGGRLGLAGGRAGSGAGGGRPAVRRSGSGGARLKFGARRGEGVLGGSLLGGSGSLLSGSVFGGRSVFGSGSGLGGGSGSGSRLAGSRLGASLFGGSLFGGSVFGGSVFGGSRSGIGRGSGIGGGSGGTGIRKPGGARIRIRGTRSGPGKTHPGAGLHAPRFRKAPVVGRLARGMSRPGQRKSPGRGWLRGSGPSAPRRSALAGSGSASRGLFRRRRTLGKSSMGKSALGGSAMGLRSGGPARLRIGRQKTMRKPMKRRRNWRGSGGFR